MTIVDRIITELQDLQPGDYGPDTVILEEIDIDSLDYASVVLTIEDELAIKLREEDIDWSRVRTVGDLASLFEAHRASTSS